MDDTPVVVEKSSQVTVVSINRPELKNAVDRETSRALHDAFVEFDRDPDQLVAVLTGSGDTFCSGADLVAIAEPGQPRANRVERHGPGPMGPTRLMLTKPTIAAVEGYCVAGGLELALWCDLRVSSNNAVFGVFCRRFGVPLIDGGTVRLPRLIGQSRALDIILTGRPVGAMEALAMGLVNRVCEPGSALKTALELAETLCGFPQYSMRSDRQSVYEQFDLEFPAALANETDLGIAVLNSGETQAGASRFASGAGRHGLFGR